MMQFPTGASEITGLLHSINPGRYAQSRNYIDGAVTRLSPYISRGVLSTRTVFDYLKSQNYGWQECEMLIRELAWRDYFQLVWRRPGTGIHLDITHPQPGIPDALPRAVAAAQTGIEGIDTGIDLLYRTGYMHNHVRMYTASLVCNIAGCRWLTPARWMYYYLLDADPASNFCSWQWVAGAFSHKKYFANQENINRYCHTGQTGTYLDVSYDEISAIPTPELLKEVFSPELSTVLPSTDANFTIDPNLSTRIYNWFDLDFYNLDPEPVNRVLLLEPSVFRKYPISAKSVQFMLELAGNIPEIQIFCGEFEELEKLLNGSAVVYKEHPLSNYRGTALPRSFLQPLPDKSFTGFFGFWKYIEKNLRKDFENGGG